MKLFLIIFVTIIADVSVSVQAGENFDIDGNQYFISTPLKKNWHQALRYCYEKGMYLIDMETQYEYKKIIESLQKHHADTPTINYWTVGTSIGSEGEFYWASTGKTIEYNGFARGQPDNAGGIENCIEMSQVKFEWNDRDCSGLNSFICRGTRYFNLEPKISGPPRNK